MATGKLPADELRWRADEQSLKNAAPRRIQGRTLVVGQPRARIALRTALTLPGQRAHVFVRGPAGSGRRSLVRSVLEELKPGPVRSLDFCYVHHFANPDRPRLIVLPGGQGRHLQQAMMRIALFIRDRLPNILDSDPIRSRRDARMETAEREVRLKVAPLESRLTEQGLALVRSQTGPSTRISIYAMVMGKAVSPEEYRNLVSQNQAHERDRLEAVERVRQWQGEVNLVAREISQIWQQALAHVDQINASEAARIMADLTADVSQRFQADGLELFLRELIDDVVEKRLGSDTSHLADPTLIYGVNVLTARDDRKNAPVVWANQPSVASLFGSIDPAWTQGGRAISSFRGIRTGALLDADGGFLIIDARHLLEEANAWSLLARSLRTRQVEVVPPSLGWPSNALSLRPEAIPVSVQVVLIGDDAIYRQLLDQDPAFSDLFAMLVDFEHSIERDQDGLGAYASFIGQLVEREALLPFSSDAIVALVEQGARLSDEVGRLSSQFSLLAELAREASARAKDDDRRQVGSQDVLQAVQQRHARAALPQIRMKRLLAQGCLRMSFSGQRRALINSVRLLRTGRFPAAQPLALQAVVNRGPESALLVDARPDEFGRLDTLAQLLRCPMVPGLRALIACLPKPQAPPATHDFGLAITALLLCSLADTPIRQGVAVIGSMDCHGFAGPVRAINERIEAFFDLCQAAGSTPDQGVIIPSACKAALMLNEKVIQACRQERFNVWTVERVEQALPLLTGLAAGRWQDGQFDDNSVLARARRFLIETE
ncbi:MAG: AAA family ATPase [Wenzhouxiangella sp.]